MANNSNYGRGMVGTAAELALLGIMIEGFRGMFYYVMDPENLVEEKKWLGENRQILMENFTK